MVHKPYNSFRHIQEIDLTIACDTFLDTEQKVDLVLKEVLDGKIKTNDDVVLKFLEIDCGYDVRVKEN